MNVSMRANEGRVRVFRDPKTGILKLRVQGSVGLPKSSENPFLSMETFVDITLEDAVAEQLRDQLLALIGVPESSTLP